MASGDYPAFPDAEAVVSGLLRDAAITGLGTRVHSSIPKSPTYPLAIVQRLGGIPVVRQYLDGPRIQIDVWGGAKGDPPGGPSKSDIHDIAAEARAVIFDAEGETVISPVSAFISGVDDALGLTWLPDAETGRDRYTFSVMIYLRAA